MWWSIVNVTQLTIQTPIPHIPLGVHKKSFSFHHQHSPSQKHIRKLIQIQDPLMTHPQAPPYRINCDSTVYAECIYHQPCDFRSFNFTFSSQRVITSIFLRRDLYKRKIYGVGEGKKEIRGLIMIDELGLNLLESL